MGDKLREVVKATVDIFWGLVFFAAIWGFFYLMIGDTK